MNAAHQLGRPGADGLVTVLLHGMEDGWQTWRSLAGFLDPSWRVVALDLPWHPGNDYRWRHAASAGEWVRHLLDGLDDQPDVIVAHSFGASALLEALARSPRPLCRAVVLVAPVVRPAGLEITWEVFDQARAQFSEVIGDTLLVRLGRRAGQVDEGLRAGMAQIMVRRIGPRGFMSLFEQFVLTAELPLRDVPTPALVLVGGKDPGLVGGLVSGQDGGLSAAMPSACVELISHYDHFCHVEYAEDVARRLVEFVREALPNGRVND